VDEQDTAMIGDIGIVGKFTERWKSIIYLAPEVLQNLEKCTKAADIYSYGIMLWEMWYGTQAFQELMPLIKAKFQEEITGGYRPKIDDKTISFPGVHSYMSLCWMSNANERPSAKDCADKFKEILNDRIRNYVET
jgi:serine/threonine protein kinase